MSKKKKAKAAPAATATTEVNDVTVAVAAADASSASADGAVALDELPAPDAEPKAPKKKRGKQAKGGMTLAELADRYLENLADIGKSRGTCFGYRGELELAIQWLGANTKLSDLGAPLVQGFFECPSVTRTRTGRLKSPLSIAKTQRVLRQAFVFAVESGWIEVAPLPEASKAA